MCSLERGDDSTEGSLFGIALCESEIPSEPHFSRSPRFDSIPPHYLRLAHTHSDQRPSFAGSLSRNGTSAEQLVADDDDDNDNDAK